MDFYTIQQEIEQITQDFIAVVAELDDKTRIEKAQAVTNKLVALPSRLREWQISYDMMSKAHHDAYLTSPMIEAAAVEEKYVRPKVDFEKVERYLSRHFHAGVAPAAEVFHVLMHEGYFNESE